MSEYGSWNDDRPDDLDLDDLIRSPNEPQPSEASRHIANTVLRRLARRRRLRIVGGSVAGVLSAAAAALLVIAILREQPLVEIESDERIVDVRQDEMKKPRRQPRPATATRNASRPVEDQSPTSQDRALGRIAERQPLRAQRLFFEYVAATVEEPQLEEFLLAFVADADERVVVFLAYSAGRHDAVGRASIRALGMTTGPAAVRQLLDLYRSNGDASWSSGACHRRNRERVGERAGIT